MTEEEGLFTKDTKRAFYRQVIMLGRKINLLLLYFAIIVNGLTIIMMSTSNFNAGIFFFLMNTWFLLTLRNKIKNEEKEDA